jgi:peptide/nickel transport system permease protein
VVTLAVISFALYARYMRASKLDVINSDYIRTARAKGIGEYRDGTGFFFIQKLGQLDLYAVMAYLLVTSVLIIAFNLLADILLGYLDPRVRVD